MCNLWDGMGAGAYAEFEFFCELGKRRSGGGGGGVQVNSSEQAMIP